jgi:hypothetical protein
MIPQIGATVITKTRQAFDALLIRQPIAAATDGAAVQQQNRCHIAASHSVIRTTPARWRAGPVGEPPNHRDPGQSGRYAIRGQGSRLGSCKEWNRGGIDSQGAFRVIPRDSRGIRCRLVGPQEDHMAGHDMAEADEWRKRAREWFVLSETCGDKVSASLLLALAKEGTLLADDIEANRVTPSAPDP